MKFYKIITNLKNDCSGGHNNIPVRYLKAVAEYIISPCCTSLILRLINKFSQNNGKYPEWVPYLKLAIRHQSKIINQFQFYRYFQKFMNVLFLITFAPL